MNSSVRAQLGSDKQVFTGLDHAVHFSKHGAHLHLSAVIIFVEVVVNRNLRWL